MSTKLLQILTTLYIIFVSNIAVCIDFHYTQNISIPNIQKLVSITSINNSMLAIQDGDNKNCTITLLNSDNYNKIKSINRYELTSSPLFSDKGILFNYGTKIQYNYYQYQITLFDSIQVAGNQLYNSQTNNIIFSLYNKCPTIATIDSLQLSIKYKQYESGENCRYLANGYFTNVGDNTIAYAYKYTIYVVNSKTLQLVNKYTQPWVTDANAYRYIDSCYDSNNNISVLLVQYSLNNFKKYRVLTNIYLQRNYQYKQYITNILNYNPFPKIALTQINQGVSFYNNSMYRWQNLNSILIRDQQIDQSLANYFPSIVFNNESIFIMDQTNTLIMYQLSEQYKITKKYIAVVKGIYYVIYTKISDDDSCIVFSAFNTNQMGIICKMDVNTKDVICLNQTRLQPTKMDVSIIEYQNNHNQYVKIDDIVNRNIQQKQNINTNNIHKNNHNTMKNRLNKTFNNNAQNNKQNNNEQWLGIAGSYDCSPLQLYSSIDRMIVVCINATFSTKYFEIHLYSISNFQLLTSLRIPTKQFWWTYVKLLKNQATFNYSDTYFPSFLLIFKLNDEYADTDDTLTIKYKIQNDTIIRTWQQSNSISYFKVHAYGQYLVSMKLKNKTHSINTLQFYDYQTFNLITKVPYPEGSTYNRYSLKPNRNIIVLDQKFLLNASYVYDLSKNYTESGWLRGSFYRDQFLGDLRQIDKDGLYMIFPKRGLFYCYRTTISRIDQPYKLIYNIAKPAIKQVETMSAFGPKDKAQGHLYLQAIQNIKGRQNSTSFYVYNSFTLIKYTNKQTKSYNIKNGQQVNTIMSHILQSSTKQHIIINSLQYDKFINTYNHISIRRIDDPNIIIYQQIKQSQVDLSKFVDYVQSGKNKQVIIGYSDNVTVIDISQHPTYANQYGLDVVQLMANGEGCVAVAGASAQNQGNIVINKNNSIMKIAQNYKIVSIVVSNLCNGVAGVTQQGYLKAWDITNQPIVTLKQQIDVQQLASIIYLGEQQILVQYKNSSINIYNTTDNEDNIQNSKANAQFSKIAVNSDGSLIASTTNSTYVQILSNSLQNIRNFKLPNNSSSNLSISDLSFTSNNTLLVSTQKGNIYILSPTPCPQTYTNIDSICLCKANETQKNNKCECKNNFIYTNDTCLCPQQQFIYNNFNGKCECGYNSSQIGDKCVCKNNFVKFANLCYCDTDTYIYIKGLCYCHPYAKQINNTCVCNQNFIKNGTACYCPSSFIFDFYTASCTCNGYIQQQVCKQCSFLCKTCQGSGFNCDSFSLYFYLILAISVLAIIAIIGLIIRKIIKNRKQNKVSLLETQKDEQQQQNQNQNLQDKQ